MKIKYFGLNLIVPDYSTYTIEAAVNNADIALLIPFEFGIAGIFSNDSGNSFSVTEYSSAQGYLTTPTYTQYGLVALYGGGQGAIYFDQSGGFFEQARSGPNIYETRYFWELGGYLFSFGGGEVRSAPSPSENGVLVLGAPFFNPIQIKAYPKKFGGVLTFYALDENLDINLVSASDENPLIYNFQKLNFSPAIAPTNIYEVEVYRSLTRGALCSFYDDNATLHIYKSGDGVNFVEAAQFPGVTEYGAQSFVENGGEIGIIFTVGTAETPAQPYCVIAPTAMDCGEIYTVRLSEDFPLPGVEFFANRGAGNSLTLFKLEAVGIYNLFPIPDPSPNMYNPYDRILVKTFNQARFMNFIGAN